MIIEITPAASTEVASVTLGFEGDGSIYIQEKLTLQLADESEFSPLNQGTANASPLAAEDTTFINAVKTALTAWRIAKGI